jgi:hypothetical protein
MEEKEAATALVQREAAAAFATVPALVQQEAAAGPARQEALIQRQAAAAPARQETLLQREVLLPQLQHGRHNCLRGRTGQCWAVGRPPAPLSLSSGPSP